MQNEQNKIPEPQWVSELMAMEVTNNQIKDLQEKWKNKYETELANLALDKVRTLPLFANVKSFLKKVFSRQYVTTKKHKIDEGKFSLNNQTWVNFAFDADIREWFLNFINHHDLSANPGFETLKKYFGDNLINIKTVNNNYYLEWSDFIGSKLKIADKQNIDALFNELWNGILKEAKIDTQNGGNKTYDNLSDEDVLKIINAYPEIFSSQNLYQEYKDKILWVGFVDELSKDDQKFLQKNNFGKFSNLEKYKPSNENFWNIYSKGSEDWLVGELDNYFKLEPEQRGDSILKKILTDKSVDVKGLANSNFKITQQTKNLGEFIKKYFDDYFGDYSEYIYCTLGEFFGDNDDFFNKVCKADATRILKYYQKYLLTDLGSDFYSRLKQETELAKGDVDKNNLNDELNLKEKANPQEQEIVKINVSEQKQDKETEPAKDNVDKNNLNNELIPKEKANPRKQEIGNVNGQQQDLADKDKNVWKKPFCILLGITVLLSIGTGIACIGFGASSLWIIAPGTGFVFTGFSGYKMFTFEEKKNYDNILPYKTNEPENNVPEMKEVEQNKNPKLDKIIKNKDKITQKE